MALSEAQRQDMVEAFQELSTETGVDGVPRLVALFRKRKGDVGSSTEMASMAREALASKAEKQVLTFPQGHSGGAVHASSKDQVWQADTASMFTFGGLCEMSVNCINYRRAMTDANTSVSYKHLTLPTSDLV